MIKTRRILLQVTEQHHQQKRYKFKKSAEINQMEK
jgi:hypothetical protein